MNTRTRTTRTRRARGFSLLELMLVIAIMGILMGVVAWNLVGQGDSARTEATKIKMQQIKGAIEGHIAAEGNPPTGLNVLVTSGKIKASAIVDAWDQPLFYAPKPPGQSPAFDLRSPGKDQTMQTEDDINIWDFETP